LIIAIDQSHPTNYVYYTSSFGAHWSKLLLDSKNQEKLFVVNTLIKRDIDLHLPKFLVFATNSLTNERLLFKVKASINNEVRIDSFEDMISNQTILCYDHCVSKTDKNVEICLDSSSVCNDVVECVDESDETDCDMEIPVNIRPNSDTLLKRLRELALENFAILKIFIIILAILIAFLLIAMIIMLAMFIHRKICKNRFSETYSTLKKKRIYPGSNFKSEDKQILIENDFNANNVV
jgi:hypothetical protein